MQYFLSAFALISAVTALPDGAPVCNIGATNVQNKHLSRARLPTTGTNEDAGYQISLAGEPLIASSTDPTFSNLFQFGSENQLVIQSATGNYLKGILVIASGGNEEDPDILDTRTPQALTITDAVGTKESIGCENFAVSSVVHTEPSEKPNLTMSFKWPTNGQKLFLDVNVVKNNNDTAGSQYYFTQYPMTATDIPDPNTNPDPDTNCGLFNLSIFCPLTLCGIFGRLFGLCNN